MLVEARKNHRDGDRTIPSSVWLRRPVVVLHRPNPDPQTLHLSFIMDGAGTDGTMLVDGGVPGERYYFKLQDGEEFPRPAYFHRRDPEDESLNRGIDLMEVGIDLAIARDPPSPLGASERSGAPPEAPLLETGALTADAIVVGRAVVAQTGLEAELTRRATLFAMPEITLAADSVQSGETAALNVASSSPEYSYRLLREGEPVGDPVAGTGAALVFTTPELEADTTFAVEVTRGAETGLAISMRVEIEIVVTGD
jgi:hypothetical protein